MSRDLFSLWGNGKILGVTDVFGSLCTGAVVFQRALPSLVLSQARWVGLQNLSSRAEASSGSPEVARSATEQAAGLGGVALEQGNLFPHPAQPCLSNTWIFGKFHPLWRAGTGSPRVALHWDGFVLEAGARVK